jgi:hypothetical protein
MKSCIPVPPSLDINAVLYRDREMPVHVRLEQRIVWNLLLALEEKGFVPHLVDDGDEQTKVKSKKAAMELLFNLDDAYFFLAHKDGEKDTRGMLRTVWIRFVFGNELDIISDYGDSKWKGFEDVMSKFNPEVFA